jgi:tricorn protease-like protein
MKKEIIFILIALFYSFIGYSQKNKHFFTFKTESSDILDICFSKNGEIFCVADDNSVKIFSTSTKELMSEFRGGHKSQIQTIDLSQDSLTLIAGSKDSTIVIWDFINNQILKTLTFQKGIITSIKISPNNKIIVSGGVNNLYFYDNESNKVITKVEFINNIITCIAFSPDGRIVATSNSDKSLKLYEAETGNLLTELVGHKNWVRSLAFSIDGTKLVSCGNDSRIMEWDISDLNNIRLLSKMGYGFNWLTSVDYYKDTKTFAFSGFNGNAEIKGHFGAYKTNVKVPINKILFKPNEGISLKIAVATRGKGVLFIDAKNMKSKP